MTERQSWPGAESRGEIGVRPSILRFSRWAAKSRKKQKREAPAFNSPDRQVRVRVTVTKTIEARRADMSMPVLRTFVIISNCLPRPYGRGDFMTVLRASPPVAGLTRLAVCPCPAKDRLLVLTGSNESRIRQCAYC